MTDRLLRNLTRSLALLARGEKQPSRIEKMVARYAERTALWEPLLRGKKIGKKVAVVVSPWMETAVPLFTIECAFAMAKGGLDVTILWDISPLFPNDAAPQEKKALGRLRCHLKEIFPIKDVAKAKPFETRDRSALCEKILHNNAIARAKGETAAQELLEQHPGILKRALKHLQRVESAIAAAAPDWILAPGGVFATSAMYLAIAQEAGISAGTFDSDDGLLFVSTEGVATHHADISRSDLLFKDWLLTHPTGAPVVEAAVASELSMRIEGRDKWGFQVVPARGAESFRCDVLVPLNLRWDTAALSRERLFPHVKAWVESIVRWASRHPEWQVCFRQHPCERHSFSRGSDDMGGWVFSHAGASANVHFVSATDEVSTYDLLTSCKVLVPYTSTMGLEACLLGIPSILSTECYYHGYGFTQSAATEREFHAGIESALKGVFRVTPEAKANARRLYFLSQLAAPVSTSFTPIPRNYWDWVETEPEKMWARSEMSDIFECLTSGVPLSFLRAKRICRNTPAVHAEQPAS
jgi:hypothetical protein